MSRSTHATPRPVALVTGASSGIGRATAIALHDAGFRTVATARRLDRVADLSARGMHTVALDVCDEASMARAIVQLKDEGMSPDVLNVSSAGGEFTAPGAGAYHASKYAVESFTDALRMEVARFGICVISVQPGGVRTEFVQAATAANPRARYKVGAAARLLSLR